MSNYYFYISNNERKFDPTEAVDLLDLDKILLDQCYFEVFGVRLSSETYRKSILTKGILENNLPSKMKEPEHGNYVKDLDLDFFNERKEAFMELQYRTAFNLELYKLLLKNDFNLAFAHYKDYREKDIVKCTDFNSTDQLYRTMEVLALRATTAINTTLI